jgi:hypothetical protein
MVRTVADVDRGLRKALKDGNIPLYKVLLEEKRLVRIAMDKGLLTGTVASGHVNAEAVSARAWVRWGCLSGFPAIPLTE